MTVFDQIKQVGILPVATLDENVDAVRTAEALLAGHINAIEVTFRTPTAAKSMREITTHVPDMLVGAGTVKSKAQVDEAIAAGAKFLLSPCLDAEVIRYAQTKQIPFIPGIQTASEINQAVKMGLNVVKFFPALAAGGTVTLKAWHATFPDVQFIPTGGIKLTNMDEFLRTPGVLAVGGSWLTPKTALATRQYTTVTALANEATEHSRVPTQV